MVKKQDGKGNAGNQKVSGSSSEDLENMLDCFERKPGRKPNKDKKIVSIKKVLDKLPQKIEKEMRRAKEMIMNKTN